MICASFMKHKRAETTTSVLRFQRCRLAALRETTTARSQSSQPSMAIASLEDSSWLYAAILESRVQARSLGFRRSVEDWFLARVGRSGFRESLVQPALSR